MEKPWICILRYENGAKRVSRLGFVTRRNAQSHGRRWVRGTRGVVGYETRRVASVEEKRKLYEIGEE
jgi:hypothetical protein